jgi:hypothetical protein
MGNGSGNELDSCYVSWRGCAVVVSRSGFQVRSESGFWFVNTWLSGFNIGVVILRGRFWKILLEISNNHGCITFLGC